MNYLIKDPKWHRNVFRTTSFSHVRRGYLNRAQEGKMGWREVNADVIYGRSLKDYISQFN